MFSLDGTAVALNSSPLGEIPERDYPKLPRAQSAHQLNVPQVTRLKLNHHTPFRNVLFRQYFNDGEVMWRLSTVNLSH